MYGCMLACLGSSSFFFVALLPKLTQFTSIYSLQFTHLLFVGCCESMFQHKAWLNGKGKLKH